MANQKLAKIAFEIGQKHLITHICCKKKSANDMRISVKIAIQFLNFSLKFFVEQVKRILKVKEEKVHDFENGKLKIIASLGEFLKFS